MNLTYFTCTLGEAARYQASAPDGQESFKSVLEMIDKQAEAIPGVPALGFADFFSDGACPGMELDAPMNKREACTQTAPSQVTFRELRNLSLQAAWTLSTALDAGNETRESPEIVGLICKTSLDFLLTWLGLARLGCVVFFIAPQLDSRAVLHLCQKSQVKRLLVQPSLGAMVDDIKGKINVLEIPPYSYNPAAGGELQQPTSRPSTTSHIFHSSGTSSGLPKPLPQSQHCAVGALPRLPGANKPATFTTTPLYHGGIADCLRSWTSGAMIWLFPESRIPITGSNVLKAVHFSQEHSSEAGVQYFSSVPYVLQMVMEEGEQGLDLLKSMSLVGFGGAALPTSIGDDLVNKGVRLISRMGSAECGFLLCSARDDFDTDKEWQFLRCKVDDDMLAFEQRDEGLFELVVKPGWPLKEHANRSDGSFATADLFEQHPTIMNAWRYHSRADTQLALDNGKKFDPSPIEDAILAQVPTLLEGVLVFGAGRTYPGALLFSKEGLADSSSVIDTVWPVMDKVNNSSPSHARISREMLVLVPNTNGQPPLEKSSKGTIMRGKAEKQYLRYIEGAYTPAVTDEKKRVGVEDIPASVYQKFTQVAGRELDPDEDLYLQGVDSMACSQIRRLIEAEIMPVDKSKLPMNVIYDNGSINKLGKFLQELISGSAIAATADHQTIVNTMQELAIKYSRFESNESAGRTSQHQTQVVVLTGATGTLGAHILHELLSDSRVTKTFCLVRAKDPATATDRIRESLVQRGFADSQVHADRVVCAPCDLTRPDLGLSELDRQRMTQEATLYIHAAWPVNFSLRLASFESQLAALHNLIKIAVTNTARFFFISSTAAVAQSSHTLIPEEPSCDPRDAAPLGYAQSKWVAEQVCAAAQEASHHVAVIRVGQLCGNKKGVWNMSEAWPLMLSTAKLTGCLPDLKDEVLDWLPVDQASQAILDIAMQSGMSQMARGKGVKVFHVLNPHRTPSWTEMLQWLQDSKQAPQFEILMPHVWMVRLGEVLRESDHSSKALLQFWKDRYAKRPVNGVGYGGMQTKPSFRVTEAQRASKAISDIKPLDQEAILNMWGWIQTNKLGSEAHVLSH
ncbi:putative NRPS-like protein biosynthetic cluster [Pyricularia oryzae]|uniref:NRPS-like protein biosynthetic cluster n=1 Tax=Pyricularia grisea TaxID=148305 RepID=A0ABQ8N9Q4_PYRGI|nr:putative NRPS-like protein biosynthetic cluster [Pyricularia oryzae]KAI6293570.1 putative NRPS-like protein biosynthetic cluster [Pyricularia grisea]KAI6266492.1 putative NRPS-like protein biosynthetic cluster [Pyricularia oryzae]KAI6274585.1 putative NRPS-like protein biosynthetic cluster [Pyricularia oryzae]KAI6306571.1 putative NRPS-like protein biosynthetic cluster [Pyricularia oryzae]